MSLRLVSTCSADNIITLNFFKDLVILLLKPVLFCLRSLPTLLELMNLRYWIRHGKLLVDHRLVVQSPQENLDSCYDPRTQGEQPSVLVFPALTQHDNNQPGMLRYVPTLGDCQGHWNNWIQRVTCSPRCPQSPWTPNSYWDKREHGNQRNPVPNPSI